MKSAYELALEKMESQGIDRPDESFSNAVRERVAEARSQAEAKLAELEILHRGKIDAIVDPAERERAEGEYRDERRRIEERRDRKIDELRAARDESG